MGVVKWSPLDHSSQNILRKARVQQNILKQPGHSVNQNHENANAGYCCDVQTKTNINRMWIFKNSSFNSTSTLFI